MPKKAAAPIDKKTELTREDIARLAGTSIAKVTQVTARDKWGFPALSRLGPKNKKLYNRTQVTAWLENNNLKTMVFAGEDRAPVKARKTPDPCLDSLEVRQLNIGIKPQQFSRHGKTQRVRLYERNDYYPPHSQLTRHSHSGAEHRYIGNGY